MSTEKLWLYIVGVGFAFGMMALTVQVVKFEKVQSLRLACQTPSFSMREQACAQLEERLIDIVTQPSASHVW
jgi:hypothetical protein